MNVWLCAVAGSSLRICLEGLRKTMKHPGQNSWPPDQGMDSGTPKYEAEEMISLFYNSVKSAEVV